MCRAGRMHTLAVVLLLLISVAPAKDKDKQQATITIARTDEAFSRSDIPWNMPGTPDETRTNCQVWADNSVYCRSTTTPGVPPSAGTIPILRQMNVTWAAIERENLKGRYFLVALTCQKTFGTCHVLERGTYAAEIKGDKIWVTYNDKGKPRRAKYNLVDFEKELVLPPE